MGVKLVSDFLEYSVTNVTLLRVTTGGWVSCFQKQLLYNTLMPPSAKWLSLTLNLITNQIISVTTAGRVTSF